MGAPSYQARPYTAEVKVFSFPRRLVTGDTGADPDADLNVCFRQGLGAYEDNNCYTISDCKSGPSIESTFVDI